jgi:molybdopterin synthase sulfur carrier subunit
MMNEITVLAFGVLTDILGKKSFVVNDISSTDELKTKLETEFPRLKTVSYTVAVNKQVVTNSTQLDSNTTVALLPPFSGG